MEIETIANSHEALQAFLAKPSPRMVPEDLLRASQNMFLKRLLRFSAVMSVLFFAILTFAYIQSGELSFVWAMPVILIMTIMTLFALITHRKTRRILAHGRMFNGTITNIVTLPQKRAWRSFYLVTITYTDNQGVTHTAKDMVDDAVADGIKSAYKNNETVEVIAAPELSQVGVLVMKLPYQYQPSAESDEPAYWFPKSKMGIGHGMPVTWQGWMVNLVFIMILLLPPLLRPLIQGYYILVTTTVYFFAGIGLITIRVKKGEK